MIDSAFFEKLVLAQHENDTATFDSLLEAEDINPEIMTAVKQAFLPWHFELSSDAIKESIIILVNCMFVSAASEGDLTLIEQLLLFKVSAPNLNILDKDVLNKALFFARLYHHEHTTEKLLSLPNIDPVTAQTWEQLRSGDYWVLIKAKLLHAAKTGNTLVVQHTLQFMPHENFTLYQAYLWANKHKHQSIIDLLSIIPSVSWNIQRKVKYAPESFNQVSLAKKLSLYAYHHAKPRIRDQKLAAAEAEAQQSECDFNADEFIRKFDQSFTFQTFVTQHLGQDLWIDDAGACNGWSFLFGFYASQGLEGLEEFYALQHFISRCDLTKVHTDEEIPVSLHKKAYLTGAVILDSVIEAVSWFQATQTRSLMPKDKAPIEQTDRIQLLKLAKSKNFNIFQGNSVELEAISNTWPEYAPTFYAQKTTADSDATDLLRAYLDRAKESPGSVIDIGMCEHRGMVPSYAFFGRNANPIRGHALSIHITPEGRFHYFDPFSDHQFHYPFSNQIFDTAEKVIAAIKNSANDQKYDSFSIASFQVYRFIFIPPEETLNQEESRGHGCTA